MRVHDEVNLSVLTPSCVLYSGKTENLCDPLNEISVESPDPQKKKLKNMPSVAQISKSQAPMASKVQQKRSQKTEDDSRMPALKTQMSTLRLQEMRLKKYFDKESAMMPSQDKQER